tara:strand:- start:454 stop:981 length:528 start_codon:yes stop_codon:yes gene_type:complete
MQLSFGAGITNYDTPSFDGSSGTYYIDFDGYTEQNMTYTVGYSYTFTTYYTGFSSIDQDIGALNAGLGYAFGDLEQGAFTLGGNYVTWNYSEGGYSSLVGNDLIINLAYERMSGEGTNYSVGLSLLTQCDNDESCETIFGQAEFPVGASNNWNFRLRGALSDGAYAILVGPTLKF